MSRRGYRPGTVARFREQFPIPADTVPGGIGFDLTPCDSCEGSIQDHWDDCPAKGLPYGMGEQNGYLYVAGTRAPLVDHMAEVKERRARILSALDTDERKARAVRESITLTNMQGGRPSDNLHIAVTQIQEAIWGGYEDQPLRGESFSAEDRQRTAQGRADVLMALKVSIRESVLESLRTQWKAEPERRTEIEAEAAALQAKPL